MKKSIKILALILGIIFSIIIGFFVYTLIISSKVKIEEDKLINAECGLIFYDNNENIIEQKNGDRTITKFDELPKKLIDAFVSIEDKRFYNHNGVDYKGILRASLKNIKNFSFKEGGSTITQQLVKNTHLTSEKTLKRKILEFRLAKKLEKKYSKNEILEFYLNTIYFGENCYGITSASKHYFDKTPSELSLNECAMLAGIVKAPSKYSPNKNYELCTSRKNVVLNAMYEQNFITEEQWKKEINNNIEIKKGKNNFDFLYLLERELEDFSDILQNQNYRQIKIYTTLDSELQQTIEKEFEKKEDADKSIIVTNKNNDVIAYYSTCGDVKRNLGSTIKPLLVYAPAIEEDVVYSCTKLKDEKEDFNGFSPSNYGDKYLGDISVKKSIKVSSNVCAVKLLNYVGIEKCIDYINKTDIKLTENDKNLAIALGSTEKGATLKEIISSYNLFLNQGNMANCSCIKKIEFENGKSILQNKQFNKIFSKSTTTIMNDMLYEVVRDGTAKKLSFLGAPLCAKTGTAGTKNGNTDAYCISYNTDYAVGVWYGKADGGVIDNNITGGNLPTQTASNVWLNGKRLLKSSIFSYDDITYQDIDKKEYDTKGNVILSDENAPERLKIKEIFKTSHQPKEQSSYFSKPKLEKPEISLISNGISFRLCLTEYINIRIFRESNGEKVLVYDSINEKNQNKFIDNFITENSIYLYSYVPYYKNDKKEILGEEVFLSKIKSPTKDVGDDWWLLEN